jgi:hypothetical protein
MIILPGFETFKKTRIGGRNTIEMNAEYENDSSAGALSKGLYAEAKEIMQETKNKIRAAVMHLPTRPSIVHRAAMPSISGISPGVPASNINADRDATTAAVLDAAKNFLPRKCPYLSGDNRNKDAAAEGNHSHEPIPAYIDTGAPLHGSAVVDASAHSQAMAARPFQCTLSLTCRGRLKVPESVTKNTIYAIKADSDKTGSGLSSKKNRRLPHRRACEIFYRFNVFSLL